MIKYILLAALILQALSVSREIRVNLNDQIVLKKPQSGKNIDVKLKSLPGNDDTVPITVQLRQISDLANPLTSTVVDSQICTFLNGACKVTFTPSTIDSTKKYTIRLSQASIIHFVSVDVQQTNSFNKKSHSEGKIFLTPLGANNPGFKFYVANAGTWKTTFKLSSYPKPTVSTYNFNLYSFNGNQLNLQTSQSASTQGQISFTISSAGFYYLSSSLTVSAVDTKTRYPFELKFSFIDDICPADHYFDRLSNQCLACSNIAHSLGTTTVSGLCDCETNYFWNFGNSTCTVCPTSGCPTPKTDQHTDNQNQNDSKPQDSKDDLKRIIDQFNSGNLRSNKRD